MFDVLWHKLALVLLPLVPLLLWDASGLDLPLARLFGSAQGFAWRSHPSYVLLLHEVPRARRMAALLAPAPGVRVLNDVVLNQVLVTFSDDEGGDPRGVTHDVIARVQADGTCWAGGASWQGHEAMRIAVSNWSTTGADIDRSAAAILACHRAALEARRG